MTPKMRVHLVALGLRQACMVLRRGQIRGTALDVMDPGPLPDGYPLSATADVFITPHISFTSPH